MTPTHAPTTEKNLKQRLQTCERVLAEHMEEFVKVGLALGEIRDEKLYRAEGFETFEKYCKTKWEFNSRRARQIVEGGKPSPLQIVEGQRIESAGGFFAVIHDVEQVHVAIGHLRTLCARA